MAEGRRHFPAAMPPHQFPIPNTRPSVCLPADRFGCMYEELYPRKKWSEVTKKKTEPADQLRNIIHFMSCAIFFCAFRALPSGFFFPRPLESRLYPQIHSFICGSDFAFLNRTGKNSGSFFHSPIPGEPNRDAGFPDSSDVDRPSPARTLPRSTLPLRGSGVFHHRRQEGMARDQANPPGSRMIHDPS